MGDYGWARITFGGDIASRTLDHLLSTYCDSGIDALEAHGGLVELEGEPLGAMFEDLEAACVTRGIQFSRRGELKYDGDFVGFWRWGMPRMFASEALDDDPVIAVPTVRAHLRAMTETVPAPGSNRPTLAGVLAWLDEVSPEQTPLPPVVWIDDAVDAVVRLPGVVRTTGREIAEPEAEYLMRVHDDSRMYLCGYTGTAPTARNPHSLAWEQVLWIEEAALHAVIGTFTPLVDDIALIQALALAYQRP
jgi:hypothetical protein